MERRAITGPVAGFGECQPEGGKPPSHTIFSQIIGHIIRFDGLCPWAYCPRTESTNPKSGTKQPILNGTKQPILNGTKQPILNGTKQPIFKIGQNSRF